MCMWFVQVHEVGRSFPRISTFHWSLETFANVRTFCTCGACLRDDGPTHLHFTPFFLMQHLRMRALVEKGPVAVSVSVRLSFVWQVNSLLKSTASKIHGERGNGVWPRCRWLGNVLEWNLWGLLERCCDWSCGDTHRIWQGRVHTFAMSPFSSTRLSTLHIFWVANTCRLQFILEIIRTPCAGVGGWDQGRSKSRRERGRNTISTNANSPYW